MINTEKISATALSMVDECPLCFWLEHKKGISRPSLPPAGILNQLDSAIKKYIRVFHNSGRVPEWLESNGFRGVLLGPQNLEFLDTATNIKLIGKLDELLKEEDGTYCVIDFKSGKMPENRIAPHYYQMQIDAYAYLVENSTENNIAKRGALVYFTLKSGDEIKNYLLPFDINVLEVNVNKNSIPKTLRKVQAILREERAPESRNNCKFCTWRNDISNLI